MIIFNPLYFIFIGIDITLFFLIVHLIQTWKQISWLASFDKAGSQIVEAVTSRTGNILKSKFNRNLTEKGRIAFSIVALTLIKFVLSILLKLTN